MRVQDSVSYLTGSFVPRFGKEKASVETVPVVTPGQFEITAAPTRKGKKSVITVAADKVAFSTHMSSEWSYWYPHKTVPLGENKLYWTKNYIGTDAQFYKKGYRWGVSLGGTPETFKRSALYMPGGGINLPNGKYLVAIKADDKGKKEVILGKEDRPAGDRVIKAFKAGQLPETNQFKEIMGVSNHSMLISRGQPFDPSKPYQFSTVFAGEVEILDHQVNAMNDQTGQIFGPNGLIAPPNGSNPGTDLVVKQKGYELDKSASLKSAMETLYTLTGHEGIRLIKVRFFDDTPPAEDLKQPRSVKLKRKAADAVITHLAEPRRQAMLDQLQLDPAKQIRFMKALGKNTDFRYGVLDLKDDLTARGTLKPEQATSLAVELMESPEALGLFLPESPYFIAGLSDNTKRKLVTAYNEMPTEERPEFRQLVRTLKQHGNLIRLMIGQRVPGSAFPRILEDIPAADRAAKTVQNIFNNASTLASTNPADVAQLEDTDPELIGNISTAKKRIGELEEKADKKGADRITVVIEKNPFNGTGLTVDDLPRNIRHLRKLHEDGVKVYVDPAFKTNKALEYLTDLYAFAHAPQTRKDAVVLHDMKTLLGAYDVNADDLHTFAQERFKKRWANMHIVTAYALKEKPFRRFLNDLNWVLTLPVATH
jgi:hypothetical protein